MSEITEKTDLFLEKSGMSEDCVDFDSQAGDFILGMEAGLRGEPGGLMMLPSYIAAPCAPPASRRVIALDAGGTSLRVAAVSLEGAGRPRIESLSSMPMPGAGQSVGIKDFFRALAGAVAPVADFSDDIGLCFSFPFESLPGGDGRIIAFGKELDIAGAKGRLIGAGLASALEDAGAGKKKVVVINDAVAVALDGISSAPCGSFSGHLGLVLGTGTNMCCFEDCLKISGGGPMAVNMESGDYGGFPQGRFDLELDSASLVPGGHKFEKMVSGRYLGRLTLLTLKGMAGAGLFSDACAGALLSQDRLDTPAADRLASGGGFNDIFVTKRDEEAAAHAARALFERAAKLVAITLYAVIARKAEHTGIALPVRIAADGSYIRRSALFRELLDARLRPRLNKRGLRFELAVAEHPALTGAAVAAAGSRTQRK